ncbi:MAG TPA: DUF6250 domain-containing protein, partial [Povalibacter sp.]|nr:DUF6250 domain-containing protein [Povalibacter sp.]
MRSYNPPQLCGNDTMHQPRVVLLFVCALMVCASPASAADAAPAHPSLRFGAVLFQDDFRGGLSQWQIEAERPGRITVRVGVLDIDVPAGTTLWFKHPLAGPVAIVFDATAVAAGGVNDRVSDLNCFWMASNRGDVTPVYKHARSGRFADYNDLLTYYVGLGGNSNTTTRFRRYIGDPVLRPLLPEHDLSARETLLVPNRSQTITLIADGSRIEYWRDNDRLFHFGDAQPYTRGWFA